MGIEIGVGGKARIGRPGSHDRNDRDDWRDDRPGTPVSPKVFAVVLAIVILLFGFMWFTNRNSSTSDGSDQTSTPTSTTQAASSPDQPLVGTTWTRILNDGRTEQGEKAARIVITEEAGGTVLHATGDCGAVDRVVTVETDRIVLGEITKNEINGCSSSVTGVVTATGPATVDINGDVLILSTPDGPTASFRAEG